MSDSAFVPEYSKPDAPGVWMNFDNTVSVYHVVEPEDTFEKAAQDLFELVKEAHRQFPDWPRMLYLDIAGHVDAGGRFTEDFVEFQQEFMFSTMAHFVTALDMPLTGPLLNPQPQRNDLPDTLGIQS
ncbi:MAG: hypothetical protein RhofKO_18370 [Rhodothermales bacterium]